MSRRSKQRKSSPAQAAAARANGAQSIGPTTPEGKAKLGGNRLTHGFRASSVSLINEDPAAFTAHLDQYLSRYQPIDKTETDLVGLCAVNMWQIMRITSIESALFNLEICGIEDALRRDYTDMDEWGRLALAFKKSSGDNALELLRRYKATAERAYHRAFQALEQIKKERTGMADCTEPNFAPAPAPASAPAPAAPAPAPAPLPLVRQASACAELQLRSVAHTQHPREKSTVETQPPRPTLLKIIPTPPIKDAA